MKRLVLILILLVIGFGVYFARMNSPTVRSTSEQNSSAAPAPEAAQPPELRAENDRLPSSAAPFISALQKINGHVKMGISYNEFITMLGDAQAAFDAIGMVETDARTENGFEVLCFGQLALGFYKKAGEGWNLSADGISAGHAQAVGLRDIGLAGGARDTNEVVAAFEKLKFCKDHPDAKIEVKKP
jgi:hypothetical protein